MKKLSLVLLLIPSLTWASAFDPDKVAQETAKTINQAKTIGKLFEKQKSKFNAEEQAAIREYLVLNKVPLTQPLPEATAKGAIISLAGSDLEIVFDKDGTVQFNGKVLNLFNPDVREFLKTGKRDQKLGMFNWVYNLALPQAEALLPIPVLVGVLVVMPAVLLAGVGAIGEKYRFELKEVRCGSDDRFFYLHPKSYPANDTPIDKVIKPMTPNKIAEVLGAQNYPKCTPETAKDLEAYLKCDPTPEIREAAHNYRWYGMDCTPEHQARYNKLVEARKKTATTPTGTQDGVR